MKIEKNNLNFFRYSLTIISNIIAILIASFLLILRLLNILPKDTKIITVMTILLAILIITLFILKNSFNKFYVIQKIAFVLLSIVLLNIAYFTNDIITLMWLSFLIMVISVTSNKIFLLYLSMLIFIGILILEFFYPPLQGAAFIKVNIIILFIAFSLLGFLISYQIEKFAHENETQRALLEKMTMIDFLTETFNRRAFFKLAQTMINEAVRNNENLGIIMIDIDHFKKINDTYGHHIGDIVLTNFARTIKRNIRKNDLFARIGGEEFVILTKTDDIEKLYELAKKIISITRNLKIKSKNVKLNITASIGAYMFNPKEETLENSLNKADIALYKAKEKRNTLVIFPDLKQKFIG
jgi:diguanylate cyclase (GGDEF)-like protein